MTGFQVLLVAGTHGNEINAPWLFDQWSRQPELIKTNQIRVCRVLGNPQALQAGKRYLDCDLNRSFASEYLLSSSSQDYEVHRARELLALHGQEGSSPCQLVIDLHSTTSSMGSSLVVYGRRASDLGLASLIQAQLGIPIYLYEGDQTQKGFLVESWPCGVVIEIGPVPQSLLLARIIDQTILTLEACFKQIARIKSRTIDFPSQLIVHSHIGSLDFPRDTNGNIKYCIHPSLQGQDWKPIQKGAPLFISSIGDTIYYENDETIIPVFINEAAYIEKHIAMSFTKKEVLPVLDEWKDSLDLLINQD